MGQMYDLPPGVFDPRLITVNPKALGKDVIHKDRPEIHHFELAAGVSVTFQAGAYSTVTSVVPFMPGNAETFTTMNLAFQTGDYSVSSFVTNASAESVTMTMTSTPSGVFSGMGPRGIEAGSMIAAFLSGQHATLCSIFLPDNTFHGGGDSFDCYNDESFVITQTLDKGVAFFSPWVVAENYYGVLGLEQFEEYDDASNIDGSTAYDGPWGFQSAWVFGINYFQLRGQDPFETYPDNTYFSGILDDGFGWGGPWNFNGDGAGPTGHGNDNFDEYTDGLIETMISNLPQDGYTDFLNWTGTATNLVGSGYKDVFTGNGLYVQFPTYTPNPISQIVLKAGKVHLSPGTYTVQFDLGSVPNFNVSGNESPFPYVNETIGSSVEGVLSAGQYQLTGSSTPQVFNEPAISITFTQSADLQITLARGNAPTQPTPYVMAVTVKDSLNNTVFFDNFDGENQVVGSLPYGGSGWIGAWIAKSNYFGLQAFDDLDSYVDGSGSSATTNLNGGKGFAAAWIFQDAAH